MAAHKLPEESHQANVRGNNWKRNGQLVIMGIVLDWERKHFAKTGPALSVIFAFCLACRIKVVPTRSHAMPYYNSELLADIF